jgi:death-on-curing protein
MTEYLTAEDVIAIHGDLVKRLGGEPGVRDMGLLQAAVYRQQTGAYADLSAEAAALWESLDQTRPFHSRNAATAFASAYAFVRVNGYDITTDAASVLGFLEPLYAQGGPRFADLDRWLR